MPIVAIAQIERTSSAENDMLKVSALQKIPLSSQSSKISKVAGGGEALSILYGIVHICFKSAMH